ncbi:protein FAM98B isoform X1 [Genypterus blacodes]|uniref:protein FAM98B isoform X1 n=1 Tax=Genypterus blacodes TaxID=154954 RepID=UPI003F7656F3
MERCTWTVCAIKALGYPSIRCLSRCDCDELPCPLLTWLRGQLQAVCPHVSRSKGDVLLGEELRALLSNMCSPLAELTSEVLEPSFLNKATEFLVSELQAAHMIKYKELHPEFVAEGEESTKESAKEQRVPDVSGDTRAICEEREGDDDEASYRIPRVTEMQAEWKLLLEALDAGASSQIADVEDEVESKLALLPGGKMPDPLLSADLSSEQWAKVEKLNRLLSEDYSCRRQMMIKRFQVTLESFAWREEQTEKHREALASVPPLASFAGSSHVSLPLLLSARQDQSNIKPIVAGLTRTSVYKVSMGAVPDRGGRPGEIEPPMPVWESRRAKGSGHGHRGGHHQRRKDSDKKRKRD